MAVPRTLLPRNWPYLLAALVVGAAGLLVLFVTGLFVFMSATATPLHTNADAVPVTTDHPPDVRWTAAAGESRRLLRAALVDRNLPGLSVAVGVDDEVVWTEGLGWADLDERLPFAPDTRVRIGTASIMLTSAAVGLLLEDGRLGLDDPIRVHVPAFPEKRWPVTLRQLMAHTSGLRNDRGDEGPFSEHCETTIEGLKLFADAPLLFEPGTRYRFSSFGWILVSAAIEAAGGEPFLRFMRHRVFDPIGMRDTRPDAGREGVVRRATFYFPRFAADPRYGLHLTRTVDLSCYAGAGVFLSTPADLVRFVLAVNGGRLLRPETVRLLQASQRLASGEETMYGLGWDIEPATIGGAATRWVGHEGTTLGGPVASIVSFPERGLVVAILSNTSYAPVEPLAVQVAGIFATQDRGGRHPAR